MRVCYVISTSSVAGGANRSLLDLIKCIKSKDKEFSCIVIMSAHGTIEKELSLLGIDFYVLPFANAIKSKNFIKTICKKIYNIYAKQKIKMILKNERVEVLHNNSLPTTIGMQAALDLKIPYICHIRENVWEGLGFEFYSPMQVKNIMLRSSCNIAISRYIKDSYNNFSEHIRYLIIPDGIEIKNYYTPSRIILDSDTVKILMVGVINPQKGQRDAIEAVKILQDNGINNIYLTIVGAKGSWKDSAKYSDELIRYTEKNNLNGIKFIPPINDIDELRKLRSEQDINLICSRAEGLGRTTIESMLSGAVTIGAAAGATSDLIQDKNTGLLYSCGNISELANCIKWVIENPNTAKQIAENGQKYAFEHFNIEEYADKIIDVYQNI